MEREKKERYVVKKNKAKNENVRLWGKRKGIRWRGISWLDRRKKNRVGRRRKVQGRTDMSQRERMTCGRMQQTLIDSQK